MAQSDARAPSQLELRACGQPLEPIHQRSGPRRSNIWRLGDGAGKSGPSCEALSWTLSNRRMLPPNTSTSLSGKAARSSARSKPRRQRRRGTRALRRPGGLRANFHERCPRSAASPARQQTTERPRALLSLLIPPGSAQAAGERQQRSSLWSCALLPTVAPARSPGTDYRAHGSIE